MQPAVGIFVTPQIPVVIPSDRSPQRQVFVAGLRGERRESRDLHLSFARTSVWFEFHAFAVFSTISFAARSASTASPVGRNSMATMYLYFSSASLRYTFA